MSAQRGADLPGRRGSRRADRGGTASAEDRSGPDRHGSVRVVLGLLIVVFFGLSFIPGLWPLSAFVVVFFVLDWRISRNRR